MVGHPCRGSGKRKAALGSDGYFLSNLTSIPLLELRIGGRCWYVFGESSRGLATVPQSRKSETDDAGGLFSDGPLACDGTGTHL